MGKREWNSNAPQRRQTKHQGGFDHDDDIDDGGGGDGNDDEDESERT